LGVIISALEVVQPGFGIVDVATVAEGVQGAEGCGEVAGDGGAALCLDCSRHSTVHYLIGRS
jgi:hypothetical protein